MLSFKQWQHLCPACHIPLEASPPRGTSLHPAPLFEKYSVIGTCIVLCIVYSFSEMLSGDTPLLNQLFSFCHIEFLDFLRIKNRPVYYHQRFRRVPDLTECEEGDYVCQYEAEMQWKRDYKVDQEILNVMRERLMGCKKREGVNYLVFCTKETQQFDEVFNSYVSRYGNLGAHASARKCLMKQKERMIEAQAKST
uniref:NADH dehydrogenase [ubiquinone] 1 beta subcomplex subunit 10 n=1 Tax=Cynoglossus semilaevis TaxID=244447 RepID=A0A3P8WG45_CYNSE